METLKNRSLIYYFRIFICSLFLMDFLVFKIIPTLSEIYLYILKINYRFFRYKRITYINILNHIILPIILFLMTKVIEYFYKPKLIKFLLYVQITKRFISYNLTKSICLKAQIF